METVGASQTPSTSPKVRLTLPPIVARTASRSSQSSPPNSQTVAFNYLSARLSMRRRNTDPHRRDPLATYANKPSQIDAFAVAKCGWINDGKDRLESVIAAEQDISSFQCWAASLCARFSANDLVEKQRNSLVEMHKEGCPWKTKQCDGVLRVSREPLQSPNFTARELRTTTIALNPIVPEVAVKHFLAWVSDTFLLTQLSSLHSTWSTTGAPTPPSGDPSSTMQIGESAMPTPELSDTSFTVAAFDWKPVPPSRSPNCRHTLSMSVFHSESFAVSTSISPSPALSCASSISPSFMDMDGTPALMPGPSASPGISKSTSASPVGLSTSSTSLRDMSLVHSAARYACLGDQAGTGDTRFTIPKSFQRPSRHKLSQRQRMSRFIPGSEGTKGARSEGLEGVEAMVTGVESKGGKDPIKYIKGLPR
ncbi:hypothetical protein F5141DRAFT_1217742 [Pisolithus sp. B1]|nr:hypothetical protein F5141DRAFT_1217742 [Pisolithus sp. B1]